MSCEHTTGNPVTVHFTSAGHRLAGVFFEARGREPLPTAVLLHGFPGNKEDVLGLGDGLRQRGINALAFNYRGTWESEGIWTAQTSLEDVSAACSFLRASETARSFAIDAARLALVGHSYGGGMALLGSLREPAVRKVVSVAGGDLGVIARRIAEDEEFRRSHEEFLEQCMADPELARGLGGRVSHAWLLQHKNEFSLVRHAGELAVKDILLIGGRRDESILVEEHVLPLYRELQRAMPRRLKIEVFDTDHSFESVRAELADLVAGWILEH
ncbi:MAG: alpha/beta fold hydrolase [Candidatus Eisenbacteria bacterium]